MLAALRPGVAAWPAALIVWGQGFAAAAHRHHCVQVVVALRGSVCVRGGRVAAWKRCKAALVRTDAVHQLDGRGSVVLIGFIDAESEMGAGLTDRINRSGGDVVCLPARVAARWRAALGSSPTDVRIEHWLTTYLGRRRRRAPVIDTRIQRVLTHLRGERTAFDDLSLNALAAIAGLSRSRFMHLFTEAIGVPLRPYVLWLRLQRAACDLMNGATVTTAAHRAGFSDAAHLTRTFRRMFGVTPSDLGLGTKIRRGLRSAPEAARRRFANETPAALV